jgi:hypothetical protein
MNLKQIAAKYFFLSSSDENEIFNKSHSLQVEDKMIYFKFCDLIELEQVKQIFSANNNAIILSSIMGLKKGLLTFKNEDGLKIYIKDSIDYILVISIGEFQPCLYKIYIESIFKKVFPS